MGLHKRQKSTQNRYLGENTKVLEELDGPGSICGGDGQATFRASEVSRQGQRVQPVCKYVQLIF